MIDHTGVAPTGRGARPQAAPIQGGISRRDALAGAGMALAAALGLGGCAGSREKAPAPLPGADSPLARLIEGEPGPIVAGERLDAARLWRFYARRAFAPVWPEHPGQAEALVAAVLRAEEHGLEPEKFRASLLRRRHSFPPLRREILLTEAILSYADALAHGGVPPRRRKGFEALRPPPVDVASVVEAAIEASDPVAVIEALAPATANYRALRKAWQELRAAPPRRRRAVEAQLAAIAANLERERWLPRRLPPERVWVDVPAQELVFFRDGEPIFSSRVVVGDSSERNQSPEFDTLIRGSFFNPPWVIPRDVVAAEILPRLAREPDFLARHNMVLLPNGEIEQSPSPEAGLGVILFDMPNRFDVYLHDTPDRFLFSRSNRRLSRGCIRVQKPRELAALLLREPIEAIDRKIAAGRTIRTPLPKPVPVFVVYRTAVADGRGRVEFRDDFYGRDADLWRRLSAPDEA